MAGAFLVKIALRSHIILGHRLTLDGLLAGILYQRYATAGDPAAGERALRELPLTQHDGVAQCSQALPETLRWPALFAVPMIQSVARDLNDVRIGGRVQGLPRSHKSRSGAPSRLDRNIDQGSGEYRNQSTLHTAIDTPSISFLGHGDAAAVAAILANVGSIGTLRTKGYGEVDNVTVTPVAQPGPRFGVVGGGLLLRPVPFAMRARLGNDVHARRAEETWRNPYRSPYRDDCLIPPFAEGESFSATELAALLV